MRYLIVFFICMVGHLYLFYKYKMVYLRSLIFCDEFTPYWFSMFLDAHLVWGIYNLVKFFGHG